MRDRVFLDTNVIISGATWCRLGPVLPCSLPLFLLFFKCSLCCGICREREVGRSAAPDARMQHINQASETATHV